MSAIDFWMSAAYSSSFYCEGIEEVSAASDESRSHYIKIWRYSLNSSEFWKPLNT